MVTDPHRLFQLIGQLFESCATHDFMTDAFEQPANPEAYHAALAGIRDCIAGIRRSGMTAGQLVELADPELGLPLQTEHSTIVPLVLADFTDAQELMIESACSQYGAALAPGDPGPMASRIRAAIAPVSLHDLLSPAVTGMERFQAVLLVQAGAACPLPGTTPAWESDDRILLAPTDDPALFSGQLYPAVFRYLVRTGLFPDPVFYDLVLQAWGDIGVVREGESDALTRVFGAGAGDLFAAGCALFRDRGMVNDVRELYEAALEMDGAGRPDRGDQEAGHVLAGVISASAEAACEDEVGLLLGFIRSTATNPSGRTDDDPRIARELDQVMQENEHLLRAVTGDYAWRAVPLQSTSPRFRLPVELLPERHLLLYEPALLAGRSPGAARALVMEAVYRLWFGRKDPADDPWFNRLVQVLDSSRGVVKGSALHPGIPHWLARFCREEYTLAGRAADRSRISRLPRPDQFLEGALYEGRTGEPAEHIRDTAVRHALAVTAAARTEADAVSDDEYLFLIREKIWPVFAPITRVPEGWQNPRTGSPAVSRPGVRREMTPRGTVARPDTPVPSPRRPTDPATGRALVGGGDSLLSDDGFSIPGGGPGELAQPGGPGGPRSGRGGGSPAGQAPGDHDAAGIPGTADAMMEACTRSRDLLDRLSNGGEPGSDTHQGSPRQAPPGQDQPSSPGRRETASALSRLAHTIGELAETLEDQVRRLRDDLEGQRTALDDPRGEELDGLLKTAEKIRKAAGEYRDAAGELDRELASPGPDHDRPGQLTGMTVEAFRDLQAAGAEFQRISGASLPSRPGAARPIVRVPGEDDDPGSAVAATRSGRLDPAFVPDAISSAGVWDSLSYFDASFDESTVPDPGGSQSGRHPRDAADRRYDQGNQALTREAELYLNSLRDRTRSDWETIDERAERVRSIALFESHAVSQDDYATYQRFYQPVAGLVMVARKNIQQALQKSRATRDLHELMTGDDIDEENLAAVRTTMRIFKDRGREPDRTRWCLSLLLDASSSMHDETVAKKLQATIQAAILFGEAVRGISGIAFEIAAFTDTEYIPLKRYQDDWTLHQGCYLIGQLVHATGGTNDVGAVSSALDRMNRLQRAAGANRMIFVISDGQSGVGGREQMRTMVKTNADTRIFGWGIGPDMEKIEETYRPYGTWVPDIADLPRSMGEVLRRELGRPAMTGWRESPRDTRRDEPAREGTCTP